MIKHTTELCPWKIPHASRIFSRLVVFSPQNHRFSGQENLRKLFDIFAKDTILLEKLISSAIYSLHNLFQLHMAGN